MKNKLFWFILIILQFSIYISSMAQTDNKYTISGHIKDGTTGEELINATVYVKELGTGNISNVYGFYSITLPEGNYNLQFDYVGYQEETISIELNENIRKDVELSYGANAIEEVTIIGKEEEDKNIQSTDMGKVNIDVETVKKLPALFGEIDIIKAIQLLPGVKSMGEGTSGFYVRGGNADQNLVLLDEAPIYNASHLLGFFSSFNPDAIKDMQLSKGAISARYGGRLSSVLDIRMKEGNSKRFGGSAGIGSIMSRLSLEAPLGKNGSFIVSGRRSYLDVMAKAYLALKGGEEDNDFTFYFYDLNAKGNYRFGENDRLFVSGYFGRDVMKIDEFGVNWGNKTSTVRWNHIFSPRLFSNLTFYYSNYDYGLLLEEDVLTVDWQSSLNELSAKADFNYYASPAHTLQFGFQSIVHDLYPGDISLVEGDTVTFELNIDKARSVENAIYVSDEWEVNKDLKIDIGLRVSTLHNLGPQKHTPKDENYEDLDPIEYESGIYNTFLNFEPRFGMRYSINNKQSVKASYNRMAQYIQQASNGNVATPFDIWFTASPNVKPQLVDQYSIGYFRNFMDNAFEFSVELYYKDFQNSIDFKEHASLLLNDNLEGELRIGKAKGYGIELMLKKDIGRLTGWLGYTYSKIEKKIDLINDDNWYNAKYDKPHDFSAVLAYELSDRISVASNFVYSSGSAVTFPTGKYIFQNTVVPVYAERNGSRLPDYHRLDFSLILKNKRNKSRRFQSEWVFGVYNAYNRKNAFAINFKQDELNPSRTYAEKSAIFSIVPSITYNAKF